MKSWRDLVNNKNYTDEQYTWFIERTNRHINLVQKYAKLIEDNFPILNGLYNQSLKHDANKLVEPYITPYIHISWMYKMKQEGKPTYKIPNNIDDNEASESHVKTNQHHPEYWSSQTNVINREDRDKPQELINATNMPYMSIAEMVADWAAMSEELGEGTPKTWAKKNINIRWKFTKDQEELIYKIIDKVWDK